jgi:succinoglycan biosynthesis transport protein ExoP
MNAQISLRDIRGIARRRYKAFILIFSAIFFASIVIALALPPIYRSKTMILIEEQQVPQDYVKSTITTYAEERLQMITRQIMKYSQMKEIVNRFNLYPEMMAEGDLQGAVTALQESIEFENISTRQGNKTSTVAFSLAYSGKDPATVQKVTGALADLYLKQENESREKLVSVTTNFLKDELENLKEQVTIHEARISKFKSQHVGELPKTRQ